MFKFLMLANTPDKAILTRVVVAPGASATGIGTFCRDKGL